ncbi:MAG TPA: serine hydrolase [Candidatus Sulfotelmatobacter sp.]|nr:serine hydrolase [Candidatus Sulfotelmatobacter sp.]
MSPPDLAALAAAAGLDAAAIHVRGLAPGGPAWSRDDGRWIYPASMIKVPLAVAAAAAVAAGRLAWTTPVAVERSNQTANDAPSPAVPGAVLTVEELVTLMLQRSDNVATNVLIDRLDREWATQALHELGFPRVAVRRKLSGGPTLLTDRAATGRNSFPAAEAAALFAALAADRVPEASRLRAILAHSWWDVRLSRGLETGDAFAHKTGDTSAVAHDGGILTLRTGARWVVVVYTELASEEENDQRFGAFMRTLRPLLLSS